MACQSKNKTAVGEYTRREGNSMVKSQDTEKMNQKMYSIFLCAALFWAVVFGIFGAMCVVLKRDKR